MTTKESPAAAPVPRPRGDGRANDRGAETTEAETIAKTITSTIPLAHNRPNRRETTAIGIEHDEAISNYTPR